MREDLEKKLTVKPLVTRLIDAVAQQRGVAITGIAGPSSKDVLRLYLDAEFNTYLEMPKEAVMEALEEVVSDLTYVTVFAPGTTRVTCTAVTNLDYLQLQKAMQHESRQYATLSNIIKTRRDTTKNSIENIR